MKFLARNSYFLNLCVCVSVCVFVCFWRLSVSTLVFGSKYVGACCICVVKFSHFSAANGDKGDSVCFEKAISVYEALIKNRTAFHSL